MLEVVKSFLSEGPGRKIMISNKTNKHLINEVLEDFARNGIKELRESLERLLNELMLSEREDTVAAAPSSGHSAFWIEYLDHISR